MNGIESEYTLSFAKRNIEDKYYVKETIPDLFKNPDMKFNADNLTPKKFFIQFSNLNNPGYIVNIEKNNQPNKFKNFKDKNNIETFNNKQTIKMKDDQISRKKIISNINEDDIDYNCHSFSKKDIFFKEKKKEIIFKNKRLDDEKEKTLKNNIKQEQNNNEYFDTNKKYLLNYNKIKNTKNDGKNFSREDLSIFPYKNYLNMQIYDRNNKWKENISKKNENNSKAYQIKEMENCSFIPEICLNSKIPNEEKGINIDFLLNRSYQKKYLMKKEFEKKRINSSTNKKFISSQNKRNS